MRRDLATIGMVLLISSGVAAAANVVGHRMEWIRRPLTSLPVNGTTQSAPSTIPQVPATETPPATEPTSQAGVDLVPAAAVAEHLSHGTALFVDAREPGEYTAGHLRGAVNVPPSAIFANIERVTSLVASDQIIIVYCGGGGCDASHNVADALRRDFGYTNVAIFEKGWEEIERSPLLQQCIVTEEEP